MSKIIVWTAEDQQAAQENGWRICWVRGEYPVIKEYYNPNCPTTFDYDEDAHAYVVAAHLAGTDALATKAIEFLKDSGGPGIEDIANSLSPLYFADPEEENPSPDWVAPHPIRLKNTLVIGRGEEGSPIVILYNGEVLMNLVDYVVVPKEVLPPEVLQKLCGEVPPTKKTAKKKKK